MDGDRMVVSHDYRVKMAHNLGHFSIETNVSLFFSRPKKKRFLNVFLNVSVSSFSAYVGVLGQSQTHYIGDAAEAFVSWDLNVMLMADQKKKMLC